MLVHEPMLGNNLTAITSVALNSFANVKRGNSSLYDIEQNIQIFCFGVDGLKSHCSLNKLLKSHILDIQLGRTPYSLSAQSLRLCTAVASLRRFLLSSPSFAQLTLLWVAGLNNTGTL